MQKDTKNVIVKNIQSCWSFLLTLSKRKASLRNLIKSIKINYEYSYLIIAKKIVFNHKFVDIKRELFLDFKKIK